MGSEVPGAAPPVQSGPCAPERRAGTNTCQPPEESTYRNGFSRVTGLCATVVYGGLGKPVAGAPVSPTKTMFQFCPVQPPFIAVSWVRNCCCVPELICPDTRESPM